ncbi:hypothetical protein CXB49_08520 [Chromobacterium sp. ATCC 53434]|uniref:TonB-dependent receptor n=1 Tax=Chromobacterium sp. (strain ATCC 53434 / SC 14030) TaxID=2059672 RepID=UPI000C78B2CD|nr:TonB-dependent receptor [Chromobacterium sp. ATCC 53434]AUH50847.1 hypothetical protein CXB49_08520 [Chromobacterium sp. ATCC 53434]
MSRHFRYVFPYPKPLFCCLLGAHGLLPVAALADEAVETLPPVQVTAQAAAPPSGLTMDGQDLRRRQLDTLGDVAERQANMSVSAYTRSNPVVLIRGLGIDADESDSVGIPVTLDGVPLNGLALGQLFDLGQARVLKGPQTLYGPNGMGGLVMLRSRDPGGVAGGSLDIELGNDGRQRLTASGDLPLDGGTFLRLAAGAENSDGPTRNTVLPDGDTAWWRNRFAHLKLLREDAAGGEWRLSLFHSDARGGNDYLAPSQLAARHQSAAGDSGVDDTAYTLASLEYRRELDDGVRLSATVGASRHDWRYWLPQSLFHARTGYDMSGWQWNGDFRLSGARGAADWMLGAFVSQSGKDAPYLFDSGPYFSSSSQADIHAAQYALYGELGWRVAPRWRLAPGMRLQYDDQRMDWRGGTAGLYAPDPGIASTKASVGRGAALPRLTLEYGADDGRSGWLTLARGYESPGFNKYALSADAAGQAYLPATATHVELGYKLSGADDGWEVGAVGFLTRLRDMQAVTSDSHGANVTVNVPRAHSRGIELNGAWRPWRVLRLSAAAGWIDARYDEYRVNGVDYGGRQFAATPKRSGRLAADWQPAESWELGVSLTHSASSALYPDSQVVSPAHNLVDAHLDWHGRKWRAGLYGKNLGNAVYYTRAVSGGYVVAGAPRGYGIRMGVDF